MREGGPRTRLGLTKVQAAVMALDAYPVGPVDAVRMQRVADA